jgi:hypothetical protein
LAAKSSILDLAIITKDGHIITIEVQNEHLVGMERRLKHYSDRLGSILLEKGDDYGGWGTMFSTLIFNLLDIFSIILIIFLLKNTFFIY